MTKSNREIAESIIFENLPKCPPALEEAITAALDEAVAKQSIVQITHLEIANLLLDNDKDMHEDFHLGGWLIFDYIRKKALTEATLNEIYEEGETK